jgi:hypothetical protein
MKNSRNGYLTSFDKYEKSKAPKIVVKRVIKITAK